MGDSIKFSGSGDLDNGMSVSVYYEIDGADSGHKVYDDYNLKLGRGDAGTISLGTADAEKLGDGQFVIIDSVGNDSAVDFTVVGKDAA